MSILLVLSITSHLYFLHEDVTCLLLRGFLFDSSPETCDIIGSQYFDFIKLFFIFNTDLSSENNEQKETTLRSTPNHRPTKIPKNCRQTFRVDTASSRRKEKTRRNKPQIKISNQKTKENQQPYNPRHQLLKLTKQHGFSEQELNVLWN